MPELDDLTEALKDRAAGMKSSAHESEPEDGDSIPHSPSSRSREWGMAPAFIRLSEYPEPGPRSWTVGGLIPAEAVTILFGHSDIGKSFVAAYLSFCVCTGRSFFGREVVEGPVLWVDRELDRDEMLRRTYQIARGAGLKKLPDDLYYLQPEQPVGSDAAQAQVLDAISSTEAVLVVLDSLTVGSTGDASDQNDAVGLMKRVEEWGTVLTIDHITKAGASGNHSSATIFGSTFKRAIARSTIRLTKAEGGALSLRQDKSNFGPLSSAIHFKRDHLSSLDGEREIVFTSVTEADESMQGAEAHAPAHEQTLIVLKRLYADLLEPVRLSLLAAEREVAEKTIRNHITKLKRDGLVRSFDDNTYEPIQDLVEDSHSLDDSSEGMAGNEKGNEVPESHSTSAVQDPTEAPEEGSPFPASKGQGTGNGPDGEPDPLIEDAPWDDEDPNGTNL